MGNVRETSSVSCRYKEVACVCQVCAHSSHQCSSSCLVTCPLVDCLRDITWPSSVLISKNVALILCQGVRGTSGLSRNQQEDWKSKLRRLPAFWFTVGIEDDQNDMCLVPWASFIHTDSLYFTLRPCSSLKAKNPPQT